VKYTVIWLPDAQDQLAELWMNATDRQTVSDAANQADHVLAEDPETKGVEFYGDRYLTVPPLRVVFRVKPDDMLVEVTMVW
jgi:hypothetical protein